MKAVTKLFSPGELALSLVAVAQGAPTRALVAAQAQRRENEPIYVSSGIIPEWIYYTTDWSAPHRERLAMLNRVAGPGGPSFENAPSRRSVPAGTGSDLVWPPSGGNKLLGLAAGIEFRAGQDYPATPLDEGWLANESARIQAAAPGVWVLLRMPHGPEAEPLDAVYRLGARRSLEFSAGGVTLARVEFQ